MALFSAPSALLFFLFTSCSLARCQELIRETFCWNQDFRLDCRWTNILAIHEAYFTNDEAQVNSSSCSHAKDGRLPCTEDIRQTINKRCSGMSHCHYDFAKDQPDRECRCKGIIVVAYSCVPEQKIESYCNIKLKESEGYISSPGYPRFYPKISNCTWLLESSIKQEMKLTILDVDMRPGIPTKGKVICPDALTILENNHKVKHVCGQADEKTRIPLLTTGGHIQVTFKSNEFLPSRGFLLHYKFNGCRRLAPPKLGYMVYSNNRSSMYMCCKGHVFNDTLSNSLFLQCVDGTYWNGTVQPCLSIEDALRSRKNGSDDYEDLQIGNADVVEVYLKKHKYIEEILIPIASVVGLVFGNVAIILLIQKIRKKRKTNGSHHNGRSLSGRGSSSTSSGTTEVPQTLRVPVTVPIESTIPRMTSIPTIHQMPEKKQAPRVLITDL
ncbi:mannan-binding lectin serine protease 1-like [Uloborus diversus]|uniref:mannan-binding lectin serine protease 1-like n=1 Tax=Uloborus diversus TaxID=327109 RepID=UPI002409E8D1|nr:mannan-binding lectin serine protease 1-like [Uloborus diversus]